MSSPCTRGSMATKQSRQKHWIPAYAGMTVSAGVRMAAREQPLCMRPPPSATEFSPTTRFPLRRLDRLLHPHEHPTPLSELDF
jgi:hypothetical protein